VFAIASSSAIYGLLPNLPEGTSVLNKAGGIVSILTDLKLAAKLTQQQKIYNWLVVPKEL